MSRIKRPKLSEENDRASCIVLDSSELYMLRAHFREEVSSNVHLSHMDSSVVFSKKEDAEKNAQAWGALLEVTLIKNRGYPRNCINRISIISLSLCVGEEDSKHYSTMLKQAVAEFEKDRKRNAIHAYNMSELYNKTKNNTD